MENSQDPNFKELELYTIPSYSRWFSWDDIHQVERYSLKEFFDASSITRTPKIYKEYRDFIISKYREEPSRRLTFTEVRKSLVGDLSLIHKVFLFLESWNLINFNAPKVESSEDDYVGEEDKWKIRVEEDKWKIRVEEGAPYGVKVVANPNSLKPVLPPPVVENVVENGVKLQPLASYTDKYGELMQQKKLVCGHCKGICDSGHYEYTKDTSFVICLKCFKNGNYGEEKVADDFKFNDCPPNRGNPESAWSEAETLLLLESVLKYGNDWELVAQHVQTKSKLDCISKLIQLPFGELMFGSDHVKNGFRDTRDSINSIKQVKLDSSESQGTTKTVKALVSDVDNEPKNKREQNGNVEDVTRSPKRLCTAAVSDTSSSLMKQVARLSMMVGPHITSSASEAAVAALCYENLCPREIFEVNEDGSHKFGSSPRNIEGQRASLAKDSDMDEQYASDIQETSSINTIPVALRMRAATATALGAAAAHAKLLADQEDREIEHLVATIIEMQIKKMHRKLRSIEDLEVVMDKEHTQMTELKELLLAKRMNVLKKIFSAGISRWRDHISVTSGIASVP